MTDVSRTDGPVVVDIQALQSATTRGRGIARYVLDWALALESERPDLIGHYLLDPTLAPPGIIDELVATGKVTYERDECFGGSSRVWHVMSAFDGALPISALWPDAAYREHSALSATVYDLIPAANITEELIDPVERRQYRTRLELVRRADQLHVLSGYVERELLRLLQIPAKRIAVVGAAPSLSFTRATANTDQLVDVGSALSSMGIGSPFVLYPSGSHPRKNNEALVRAFAGTPDEIRNQFQLVITGNLPESTRHHLRHLAEGSGAVDRVIVTGEVGESRLWLLYQQASLVCVPSLAEGYGLPVAEALATRTPVIASDVAPFDELLDEFARFDPTSDASIRNALVLALTDPTQKARLSEQRSSIDNWQQIAARTGAAFDELLATLSTNARQQKQMRMRLGFVTPLPPAATGVANYSYRLIEELVRAGCTVDVFVENSTHDALVPEGATAYGVDALLAVESLTGTYDHVIYTLGNSHHHLGAIALLRKRPGVVVSHDVRLTNVYRHEHGDPGLLRGGFGRTLDAMYGEVLSPELDIDGDLGDEDLERYGLFMSREAVECAEGFLVSSKAAVALARVDAGPGFSKRIAVLPFAIESTPVGSRDFVEGRTSDGDTEALRLQSRSTNELGAAPLVAHFGIVDPSKRPRFLLEAVAKLRVLVPDTRVAFVGPISARLVDELSEHADAFGLSQALIMTGALPTNEYRSWLDRATVAVQLRAGFNGEASAAVGECLASGVPTIVSALGWFGELPDNTVVKVSRDVSDEELAARIMDVLGDPGRQGALRSAARAYAMANGFDRSARALLEHLNQMQSA